MDYFQAIYNYSYLLQFLGIRRYLNVYVNNLYASGIKVFSFIELFFFQPFLSSQQDQSVDENLCTP